ncbi:class I SAM-dependent methyltransferase [Patescibacteria group bacterium]|nr:class I SAM-dependent methyltransferase [Patescibacteria group bacterium]MBU1758317.1 class I SAM-dependent methyltransferase [Patescibacteria group bacterium]
MIKDLELKNVRAIPLRAEEYNTKFDVVTVRAVAYANKLLPWVFPLIKK